MLCTINSNHMLNLYAKCGRLNLAHQLFDEMSERNLVTWSALISGYDQAGIPLMGINLFAKMRTELLLPNEFIFASVLSSCASLVEPRLGQQIHAQAFKLGCSSISFVSNSLISMYMKCGECTDAMSVFDGASGLSCVSYNAIIAGLVENKQFERGFEMFKTMCQKGLIPDGFTFIGVLATCNDPQDLWRGMQLHCQTIKLNLDSMATIGNVMITMYAKFNLIEAAEKVFRLLEEKDTISWNTMIAAFSQCDELVKALSVFREMVNQAAKRPDEFSYASALSACAGIASVRHGKEIHAHIIRIREDKDTGVSNALVNMYAKCGLIGYASTVFDQMDCHNIVSWNSIISGFANHGLGGKALEMFVYMKDAGINPDSVTFVGLLTACNHTGLVDEGQAFFNSMETVYTIRPDLEHFSCLIDLLGKAGRLSEAEEHVQNYNFGHDPVVLGCLLSACRLHGDVDTGKRVATRLLNLQPVTSSPYVLLSNLYASDGMWADVAEARKMLKGSGLKKEPGWSLIDVDGSVEKFTMGDFCNSRMEEMVDILEILNCTADEEFF